LKLLTCFFVSVAFLVAVDEPKPLGSVSSKGPVVLSGTTLDVSEIPSWPIMVGDVIQTSSVPAIVMLDDGSRLLIDASSEITLTKQAGKMTLVVGAGKVTYSLSRSSTFVLMARQEVVSAHPGAAGVISVKGDQATHDRTADELAKISKYGRVPRDARPILSPHQP
jgi:hypothetical protein